MIELQQVTLFYEQNQALNSISAKLDPGNLYGLAGVNGAGKSSLIKCLLGLIKEFDGQITIAGHNVKRERAWVKQHCSYAPEETELFDYLTGYEFLQLIAAVKKVKHVPEKITFLNHLFDMHSFIGTIIADYSHGMRQKMLLAAALMGEPDYLFIDEAINGLDTLSLIRLKDYLHQLTDNGKTIVLASHVLHILTDWCDQILILHQGRLVKMLSKKEIQTAGQSFEQIFIKLISGEKLTK